MLENDQLCKEERIEHSKGNWVLERKLGTWSAPGLVVVGFSASVSEFMKQVQKILHPSKKTKLY